MALLAASDLADRRKVQLHDASKPPMPEGSTPIQRELARLDMECAKDAGDQFLAERCNVRKSFQGLATQKRRNPPVVISNPFWYTN